MEKDTIQKLREKNTFTGKNGAFTGLVTPLSFKDNEMKVTCQKDGSSWCEEWDLQYTVWGFERGDYQFI